MNKLQKTSFLTFCLSLFLIPTSLFACNASVKFHAQNNCPWPVDFKTHYDGNKYSSQSFTLQPGESYNIGEKWETTINVSDSYGDRATVWLHSKYTARWPWENQCTYYYSPRNVVGYYLSGHDWHGSAPTVTFTACQSGAIAKIKTIGLGNTSISKNGLLQKDSQTINLTSDKDTYKIHFTSTGSYCTFKLGEGIYCDQNDVGAIFTTGNLIFACQQVNPQQGRCGWANKKDSVSSSGYINIHS
ncbi:MAG: hypothetical protein EP298_09635 [Gammaproteobacteria bacterium]|nr:MAG: hypothetical protein EP298_09635 [Gammaproteobacteria bacterium]UTW42262.1 hypothetical protein KFE69_12350 [bacterium SCSIO 12844]